MPDVAAPAPVEIGGVLRRYDWGSTTLLPQLLGRPPDGRPAAELWFGAHAGDPSPVVGTELTLDGYLAAADEAPLPFLTKILAAGKPLSIQVHPTRAQARAGFAREDAAGIPRDARERNYVDPEHKPELLCALTPFEALCGFRPVDETLALLDDLDLLALGFVAEKLRGPDGLRAAFVAILEHSDPAGLAHAVAGRATEDGPLRPAWLAAQAFPDDVGVALTVLLNAVRLQPGEAIYLGAGNVHAYLRGMGVEVMASSDNVLRCGLTSKHVDVAELLAVTDFHELREPRFPARDGRFDVPVPDFALAVVADDRAVTGPAVVLCTDGTIRAGGVDLTPGRAVFVPAGVSADVAAAGGQAHVSTPGRAA